MSNRPSDDKTTTIPEIDLETQIPSSSTTTSRELFEELGVTPVENNILEFRDIELPFISHTRKIIEDAQEARMSRGEHGGLTLGQDRFYQLNRAWSGIDKGVHLIGGETNIGKSAFMRMVSWDIAKNNPNVHVRFYTLDDSEEYFLSCLVAQSCKVPINAIDKPHAYARREPNKLYTAKDYLRHVEVGNANFQRFINGDYLDSYSFIGQSSLQSTTWQAIADDIRITRAQLARAGKELVVFIDNFHDITFNQEIEDRNALTEGVAIEAHKLAEQEKMVIFGTVELRKNSQRRPILDDILGSRKWKYKARSVILLYSEVGVGKYNPRIKWSFPATPDKYLPVLEVHFAKSKTNDFKDRLFYHQTTEAGFMQEVSYQDAQRYAAMM